MANKSGKESFVAYETMYDLIKRSSDSRRLKMYDAIFQYGLYGIEPNFEGDDKSVFELIMWWISDSKSRRKTQQTNGVKGGAPEGNKNAFKDKKCSACKNYRICKNENKDPYLCNDYYDKNKNNPNQAKTSENDLNVNVNEFKALSLNVPRLSDSSESEIIPFPEDTKVNEEVNLNSYVVQPHHAERSSAIESDEEGIREDIHYSADFVPLPKPKKEVIEEPYVDKRELENSLSIIEQNFKSQSLDEAAEYAWNLAVS